MLSPGLAKGLRPWSPIKMKDASTGQNLPAVAVRLRTVLLIRWIAAAGQLATVLIVHFGLDYVLPLLPCIIAVSVLAVSNLVITMVRSTRGRLADGEALALLGFDAVQLTCLLYLTGGLANPFGILILAPVVVSATILSRRATITLTGVAVLAITGLAYFHLPLPWSSDRLSLPLPYILGIWTALAVATVFISTYVWSVAEEARRMSEALSETQAALARAQRLAALDGLAAAAAHELGSPLATIAVVAHELSREVPADSPIAEDVSLLVSQSERCRDILADIAAQPEDRGGAPFERLPFTVFLQEAVDDATGGSIETLIEIADELRGEEPHVDPRPEILRGLGNLIQNAEQFARSRVTLTTYWDGRNVNVTIRDDGPGFPQSVLAAIGEPYISTRTGRGDHMGLGIFIAQTLLERSGASLGFSNKCGGEVAISWPRTMLEGASM